jgi:acylphosphatase
MIVCKRAIYWGRVQGVGFRATALQLARDFVVAGHVRNLPDGTVELIAEGEAGQVEGFLEAVARTMSRYLTYCAVAEQHPENRQGFRIRY